jgi:hypothetical protein
MDRTSPYLKGSEVNTLSAKGGTMWSTVHNLQCNQHLRIDRGLCNELVCAFLADSKVLTLRILHRTPVLKSLRELKCNRSLLALRLIQVRMKLVVLNCLSMDSCHHVLRAQVSGTSPDYFLPTLDW